MPLNLPTLASQRAQPQACPKGKSRLETTQAEKKLTVVDERAFKAEVLKRDRGRCRMCGRKVLKALARIPERAEVHHLHGRLGDLRFEARAAILVDCQCHEKLTGRVAEKWIAIGSRFWTLNGDKLIDARARVTFQRVA